MILIFVTKSPFVNICWRDIIIFHATKNFPYGKWFFNFYYLINVKNIQVKIGKFILVICINPNNVTFLVKVIIIHLLTLAF